MCCLFFFFFRDSKDTAAPHESESRIVRVYAYEHPSSWVGCFPRLSLGAVCFYVFCKLFSIKLVPATHSLSLLFAKTVLVATRSSDNLLAHPFRKWVKQISPLRHVLMQEWMALWRCNPGSGERLWNLWSKHKGWGQLFPFGDLGTWSLVLLWMEELKP